MIPKSQRWPRTNREFRPGNPARTRARRESLATATHQQRPAAGAGAVLLLGPLAFGAVEPWSIFALETCAVCCCSRSGPHASGSTAEFIVSDHVLYRPMAAFFVLVLVQWVIGTTAYRQVTYSHLLLYAAYGMLVFVVTQTLRRASQFELMAKLFTGYGAIVAAFAVLQGLAPNGKLYWIWGLRAGRLDLWPLRQSQSLRGSDGDADAFPAGIGRNPLYRTGIARLWWQESPRLMAGSIFLSGSRGGMAAFVARWWCSPCFMVRKREGNWKQPLLLGSVSGAGDCFSRLDRRQRTHPAPHQHSLRSARRTRGGTRLTIDRDCLHMLLKRPFLGWGLGTFPVVYPEFRSFYTTFFVNQAHNDYLQLLVETGLAGFCHRGLVSGGGLPPGCGQT
jgi:hypothetical protein